MEEALGFPYIIHVVVQDHNGDLRLTRGAMYSQYEFTVPQFQRLNNKDWAGKLSSDPPDFHDWIKYLISDEKPNFKQYQPVQMQKREEPWGFKSGLWFGPPGKKKNDIFGIFRDNREVSVYKLNEETAEFEKIPREKINPKKLLHPNSVLLFCDPNHFKAWIWHGCETTTRMKFLAAKLAPSVRESTRSCYETYNDL